MHQYSPDGELLSKWGSHTRDAQGFSGCCNPVSLAAAPDGSVLTAERGQPRVKSFSGDGRLTRVLAGPEQFAAGESAARAGDVELPGCTDGVIDVATSPAGEVMVLDRTTGVVRVIA